MKLFPWESSELVKWLSEHEIQDNISLMQQWLYPNDWTFYKTKWVNEQWEEIDWHSLFESFTSEWSLYFELLSKTELGFIENNAEYMLTKIVWTQRDPSLVKWLRDWWPWNDKMWKIWDILWEQASEWQRDQMSELSSHGVDISWVSTQKAKDLMQKRVEQWTLWKVWVYENTDFFSENVNSSASLQKNKPIHFLLGLTAWNFAKPSAVIDQMNSSDVKKWSNCFVSFAVPDMLKDDSGSYKYNAEIDSRLIAYGDSDNIHHNNDFYIKNKELADNASVQKEKRIDLWMKNMWFWDMSYTIYTEFVSVDDAWYFESWIVFDDNEYNKRIIDELSLWKKIKLRKSSRYNKHDLISELQASVSNVYEVDSKHWITMLDCELYPKKQSFLEKYRNKITIWLISALSVFPISEKISNQMQISFEKERFYDTSENQEWFRRLDSPEWLHTYDIEYVIQKVFKHLHKEVWMLLEKRYWVDLDDLYSNEWEFYTYLQSFWEEELYYMKSHPEYFVEDIMKIFWPRFADSFWERRPNSFLRWNEEYLSNSIDYDHGEYSFPPSQVEFLWTYVFDWDENDIDLWIVSFINGKRFLVYKEKDSKEYILDWNDSWTTAQFYIIRILKDWLSSWKLVWLTHQIKRKLWCWLYITNEFDSYIQQGVLSCLLKDQWNFVISDLYWDIELAEFIKENLVEINDRYYDTLAWMFMYSNSIVASIWETDIWRYNQAKLNSLIIDVIHKKKILLKNIWVRENLSWRHFIDKASLDDFEKNLQIEVDEIVTVFMHSLWYW